MMSFKQFLAQQDDSIEDTEAIQKYNEYKRDVKKKQLQFFFDKHKDEEWLVDFICNQQSLWCYHIASFHSQHCAIVVLYNGQDCAI